MEALKQTMNFFFEKLLRICENLNRSQRLYLAGAILGVTSLFCSLTPYADATFVVYVAAGVLLTLGALSDLLIIYKTIWATAVGKGMFLLIYALSTNVAYAVASKGINELIQYDISGLPYTINLVAILLAPVFIFVAILSVLMTMIILGQFYLLLVLYADNFKGNKCLASFIPQPKESYPIGTVLFRLIATPIVVASLWWIGDKVAPNYLGFIEEAASSFIYNIEADKYPRCKISVNSRAIKVTENEIIEVSRNGEGFVFKPIQCIPVIIPVI